MGLLILEREVGEWVHVGPDIHVLLHDIRGKRGWLGFQAPRHIDIVRDDAAVVDRKHGPRLAMSEEQCLELKELLLKTAPYTITTPQDLYACLAGFVDDVPS